MSQWGVYFQGLTSDKALLVTCHMFQGAQVVKAVGEFDENDANVLRHGHQHFTETFRLPFFLAEKLKLAQFRDTGNKCSDFRAEQRGNLFLTRIGIFNGVVQKGACNGHRIHLQFGQNGGDFQGVGYVRDAGFALLMPVCVSGKFIGLANQVRVSLGMVLLNCGDNGINGQHFIVVYGSIETYHNTQNDRVALYQSDPQKSRWFHVLEYPVRGLNLVPEGCFQSLMRRLTGILAIYYHASL